MLFNRSVLCLTVVCICVVAVAPAEMVRFDDHKLVRAHPQSLDQIEELHALGALLMSDYEGIGPVDYVIPPEAMGELELLGIPFKVLDDNIQKAIDAERALLDAAIDFGPRDPAWFTNYKTFDQIVTKLNALVVDRPDLCTLIDIGDTLEGRDIWCLRISGPGTDKPAVLFNGTQHAREWISPMVNMWIADRLVSEYDTNPDIQSLVNNIEFFIVPVINADGYVYTWSTYRLWRKNRRNNGGGCYGVDPNRNWAEGWGGGGSSGDPCNDTYRGTAPFSEPCTQAISNFFIANPQIVSNIDYHSYSELILSPYGYTNALPPDHDTFMYLNERMHDEILAVHGHDYEYGPIYTTIYQASGGSVDWVYGDQGIFSFTIELRPASAGGGGFELPADQIIPTCEENFPAAMFLAEWSYISLMIDFPNGLPTRLLPDTAEDVIFGITEVRATLDPDSPRLYTRIGGGSFTESTPTPLGNNEYSATLPATACGRTLEYYFTVETTDGEMVYSPGDAPSVLHEVTAAPVVMVLDADMSTNPGWTTQGQWAWGQPTGGGGQYGDPDPTSGFTGANVFGYNLYGDYANNMSETHLTTTAFDCSSVTGATLSFQRWLGVEQPAYDHAYLRISTNGSAWNTLWTNGAEISDNGWVYSEYDISTYADGQPAVYLRWTMGTTDSSWQYCGWNIDDVQVWGADPDGCGGLPGDMDCDGDVDFDDIDGFVLALGGEAGYMAQYPGCIWLNADANDDGDVDFDDIDAFVALIGG